MYVTEEKETTGVKEVFFFPVEFASNSNIPA